VRITLIQPPKPAYQSVAEGYWELARPFSLFYLATALEQSTPHEVRILDFEKREYRDADPAEVLRQHPSDIFGITAVTFSRFEAIRLAKAAKALHPGSFVLAGGVHFMHCAGETLERVPEIDAVAHGEGEGLLPELADALAKRGDLGRIDGLSFRRDGLVTVAATPRIFEGMDDLPPYDRFDWQEYPEYLFGHPGHLPAVSVMSSRGCPYRCVFCAKSGSRYRLRDPGKVVREIGSLQAKFGVSCFNFLDLTFTAAPGHTREVCRRLVEAKLDIRWWCESRVNIPLDLLPVMRDAGCASIAIGVESGSPRVLASMQKDISVDQVEAFCRRCLELGIHVSAYFMYSHPGEELRDARLTLDLLTRLQERGVSVGGFQPSMIFPGSGLERLAREKGILPPGFSWSAPYESALNRELGQLPNVPLFIDRLRPEDLLRLHREHRRRLDGETLARDASELPWGTLLARGVRSVLLGKASARQIWSPRFYRQLAAQRRQRRGRTETGGGSDAG
jgi:radical SAM superfamily enzyme YgiQ (UPF0313 family)